MRRCSLINVGEGVNIRSGCIDVAIVILTEEEVVFVVRLVMNRYYRWSGLCGILLWLIHQFPGGFLRVFFCCLCLQGIGGSWIVSGDVTVQRPTFGVKLSCFP